MQMPIFEQTILHPSASGVGCSQFDFLHPGRWEDEVKETIFCLGEEAVTTYLSLRSSYLLLTAVRSASGLDKLLVQFRVALFLRTQRE